MSSSSSRGEGRQTVHGRIRSRSTTPNGGSSFSSFAELVVPCQAIAPSLSSQKKTETPRCRLNESLFDGPMVHTTRRRWTRGLSSRKDLDEMLVGRTFKKHIVTTAPPLVRLRRQPEYFWTSTRSIVKSFYWTTI